jgi:DNA gyrase subunit B
VERARLDKVLGSQEIATLITALGCGIGEALDLAKLRYHRIIIMTDADVDGSHIRALLLTFFYRQYPQFFDKDREFLYIAQPPLYKVKKGKKELYLKNEQALEDYVVRSATEELRVGSAADDPAKLLEGDPAAEFIRRVLRYVRVLGLLDKRADSRIVDALIQAADLSRADLADAAKLEATLREKVSPYLASRYKDFTNVKFELKPDAEHGGVVIHVPARLGSARKATDIDFGFLVLPEYEELRRLREEIGRTAQAPYVLERGGDRTEYLLLGDLARSIDDVGRKGLQIQRYKGLGEMNAEQLWETTMNPEKRTLLKVSIQDAPEAEKIFTTLMGDLVEPRREFIEKNALNVRNLDV